MGKIGLFSSKLMILAVILLSHRQIQAQIHENPPNPSEQPDLAQFIGNPMRSDYGPIPSISNFGAPIIQPRVISYVEPTSPFVVPRTNMGPQVVSNYGSPSSAYGYTGHAPLFGNSGGRTMPLDRMTSTLRDIGKLLGRNDQSWMVTVRHYISQIAAKQAQQEQLRRRQEQAMRKQLQIRRQQEQQRRLATQKLLVDP